MTSEWVVAWFLASVELGDPSGPCSLSAVIEAADAINHSIMNLEELKAAVSWLIEHNLLAVDQDNRFSLSALGAEFCDGCPAKTVLQRVDWLSRHLDEAPASEGRVQWQLSKSDYESAVNEHHHRFAEQYERIERRDSAR